MILIPYHVFTLWLVIKWEMFIPVKANNEDGRINEKPCIYLSLILNRFLIK